MAQELVTFLFTKGWSLGQLDEIFTAGLLPERIREAFGFAWSPRTERRHRAMRAAIRYLFAAMPDEVRLVPAWHQATARIALARGERPSPLSRLVNHIDRAVDLPLSLKPVVDPADPLFRVYERWL
ncbi:oxygenase MpaB family protein [Sorangium sp. So ce134]